MIEDGWGDVTSSYWVADDMASIIGGGCGWHCGGGKVENQQAMASQ